MGVHAMTERAAIERLLASAPCSAYYRFRVGRIGDGTCTLDVPFHEELSHHTVTYALVGGD